MDEAIGQEPKRHVWTLNGILARDGFLRPDAAPGGELVALIVSDDFMEHSAIPPMDFIIDRLCDQLRDQLRAVYQEERDT